MAVLATLKLVNAKKSNSISPTQLRRNKLSRKLWEQIELAKAVAAAATCRVCIIFLLSFALSLSLCLSFEASFSCF